MKVSKRMYGLRKPGGRDRNAGKMAQLLDTKDCDSTSSRTCVQVDGMSDLRRMRRR